MSSLQNRVKRHKAERLNQLESIIAINDDGLLDIKHLKILAAAIVKARPTKINLATTIALNDGEQMDLEHIKKVANAIAEAYEGIEWEKLKEKKNE